MKLNNIHILECAPGWYRVQDQCLKIFHRDGFLTWTQAQEACRAVGANLATVPSEETNEFIKERIERVTNWIGGSGITWIGVTDQYTEGTWVTAGSKETLIYTNWFTEPQKYQIGCPYQTCPEQNCAMMVARGLGVGKWEAKPCSGTFNVPAYICSVKGMKPRLSKIFNN